MNGLRRRRVSPLSSMADAILSARVVFISVNRCTIIADDPDQTGAPNPQAKRQHSSVIYSRQLFLVFLRERVAARAIRD
jgi:hypothetical protein